MDLSRSKEIRNTLQKSARLDVITHPGGMMPTIGFDAAIVQGTLRELVFNGLTNQEAIIFIQASMDDLMEKIKVGMGYKPRVYPLVTKV